MTNLGVLCVQVCEVLDIPVDEDALRAADGKHNDGTGMEEDASEVGSEQPVALVSKAHRERMQHVDALPGCFWQLAGPAVSTGLLLYNTSLFVQVSVQALSMLYGTWLTTSNICPAMNNNTGGSTQT